MFGSRLTLFVCLIASGAFGAEPAAATYKFNDPNNRDTVSFTLDAPLETINGLSNHVSGQVTVAKGKASGELKVPVKELRTGNSTRDEHLAGKDWLDAGKYPDIIVTFKDVAVPAAENGKPLKLSTKGTFTLHGVTREEPVEVTATVLKESEETKNRLPGDLLRIKARFQIPLEPYGIKRTRALLLKVGETADVTVDAWGSTKS